MKTYYDILDVDEDASQADIKSSYQEKVKEVHPDQNDYPNAAQEFMLVREAWDVLGDDDERARYDRLGHDQYLQQDDAQSAYSYDGVSNTRTDQNRTTDRESAKKARSHHGKTDPRNRTRGVSEAEYIWREQTDRVAEPSPVVDTAGEPLWKRLVTYPAVVVLNLVIGLMTFYVVMMVLGDVATEGWIAAAIETLTVPGFLLVLCGISLGSILASEAILDCRRQLREIT